MVSNIYDSDFLRMNEFLAERFPGMELVPEEEYDMAYEEYEEMYPMNLVLFENRFEFIFYNRPIGSVEHYWKIPGYHMIWKHGEFFMTLRREIRDSISRMTGRKTDVLY
jgi:hypothetical protein